MPFEIACHYTTLPLLHTALRSWASPVASWVCRLSCWALDHDRCLSESARASLLIFSTDTKIKKLRNFNSFEKYFKAFGAIRFSFNSKVFFSLPIGLLYVQRVGRYILEVLCKVRFFWDSILSIRLRRRIDYVKIWHQWRMPPCDNSW